MNLKAPLMVIFYFNIDMYFTFSVIEEGEEKKCLVFYFFPSRTYKANLEHLQQNFIQLWIIIKQKKKKKRNCKLIVELVFVLVVCKLQPGT